MNDSCAHVQKAVTSTWNQDTCQIRLLVNRRLNGRWNCARRNDIMIADAWSEGLVADEYSNRGGQSWSQCLRCWRLRTRNNGGLQKAAAWAFTQHRLSSRAGIDFNIYLQWPSTKHGPAVLAALLKRHCYSTSQWLASDIHGRFVSLLKTETAFPKDTGNVPSTLLLLSVPQPQLS